MFPPVVADARCRRSAPRSAAQVAAPMGSTFVNCHPCIRQRHQGLHAHAKYLCACRLTRFTVRTTQKVFLGCSVNAGSSKDEKAQPHPRHSNARTSHINRIHARTKLVLHATTRRVHLALCSACVSHTQEQGHFLRVLHGGLIESNGGEL